MNIISMHLHPMQSLSAAQGAGNTLVFGMPGGFVPLKNGPKRDGNDEAT